MAMEVPADERYFLPSSAKGEESERLNLQDRIFLEIFDGKLGLAPVSENVKDAIDVGCGTGVWTKQFALANPTTKVLGGDLTPPKPEATTPANCSFMYLDAQASWNMDNNFDYVHARLLTMGMTDWSAFFKEAYQAMKPDAWLEICDVDIAFHSEEGLTAETSSRIKLCEFWRQAIATVGVDTAAFKRHEARLQEAGFKHVERHDNIWPLAPWSEDEKLRRIGRMSIENFPRVCSNITSMVLPKVSPAIAEQMKIALDDTLAEMRDDPTKGKYWLGM